MSTMIRLLQWSNITVHSLAGKPVAVFGSSRCRWSLMAPRSSSVRVVVPTTAAGGGAVLIVMAAELEVVEVITHSSMVLQQASLEDS